MTAALGTLRPILSMVRLHLSARATEPLHLPEYAGSMLRGAFGHALRGLALMPHENNEPCALHETCPYCQIFATHTLHARHHQGVSQVPQPYIIEPPALGERILPAGECFGFGLVLIERALDQLPLVILAFERGLKKGLGKSLTPCTLLSVQQQDRDLMVWGSEERKIRDVDLTLPAPAGVGQEVTLRFKTPLRLQCQGRLVGKRELNARTLLVGLARRYQMLADIHLGARAPQQDFKAIDDSARALTLDCSAMQWFDWGRFSNRQQKEMMLGGLVGDISLRGDLRPFEDLLHLGQWFHVGKETTFGLGHYELVQGIVTTHGTLSTLSS